MHLPQLPRPCFEFVPAPQTLDRVHGWLVERLRAAELSPAEGADVLAGDVLAVLGLPDAPSGPAGRCRLEFDYADDLLTLRLRPHHASDEFAPQVLMYRPAAPAP